MSDELFTKKQETYNYSPSMICGLNPFQRMAVVSRSRKVVFIHLPLQDRRTELYPPTQHKSNQIKLNRFKYYL